MSTPGRTERFFLLGLTLVSHFFVRPAAHVCLCGESPLTAREGEGLTTRQSQGGNKLMKEADSK